MIKRISLVVTIVLCFVCFSMPFSANAKSINSNLNDSTEIEYFSDGSYMVTTYETDTIMTLSTTVSKTKSVTYYSGSDVPQYKFALSGTFSYNGTSATCTSATHSTVIYNDEWYVSSASSSKSANQAFGDATFKRKFLFVVIDTMDVALTLTCSPTGVIS